MSPQSFDPGPEGPWHQFHDGGKTNRGRPDSEYSGARPQTRRRGTVTTMTPNRAKGKGEWETPRRGTTRGPGLKPEGPIPGFSLPPRRIQTKVSRSPF